MLPALAVLASGSTLAGHALASDHPKEHANILRLYSQANFDAEFYIRANGEPPPVTPNDVAAVGDVTILEDQLFALQPHTNQPAGSQLGTSNGQCTFVAIDNPNLSALRAEALCSTVVTLDDGTITLDGYVTIDFAKTARDMFAITGGTGAYNGAKGTATVTGLPAQDDSESAIYEFRFSR